MESLIGGEFQKFGKFPERNLQFSGQIWQFKISPTGKFFSEDQTIGTVEMHRMLVL